MPRCTKKSSHGAENKHNIFEDHRIRIVNIQSVTFSEYALIKNILFSITLLLTLVGCEDKISTLGSPYFPDTVQLHTITRTDTGFMQFSNYTRSYVTANGVNYNLTFGSPLMIVGRALSGSENVEAWGLLRFIPFNPDSLTHVIGLRLILSTQKYAYGDTTNSNVSLRVYTQSSGKVTDSTIALSTSDLSSSSIGNLDTTILNDTGQTVAINLDTNVKPMLTASSLAFVVLPSATMTNARAFRTCENAAYGSPELEYTLKYGDSVFKVVRTTLVNTTTTSNGTLDMFIVRDQSVSPPHEFTVRGGVGEREHIFFNLARPNDTANLNQFSTINSALLKLKVDWANSRHSGLSFDTTLLGIKITGIGDTAALQDDLGVPDPTDPTGQTYEFQVRGLIESWLRTPTSNLGFDIRAGFQSVNFGGTAVPTEGNTLNRWTFYGSDYPDSTKRPQLIISYSQLR